MKASMKNLMRQSTSKMERRSASHEIIDVNMFAELVRHTKLIVNYRTPLALETGPSLGGRIRGAWGNALLSLAQAGVGDAKEAIEALFSAGHSGQKPFALRYREDGPTLTVELCLFGAASYFRDVAFEALHLGLTQHKGLNCTDSVNAKRVRLVALGSSWKQEEGFDLHQLVDPVRLRFLSPFKIGPAGAIGTRYSDLWISAMERSQAIAAWHGFHLHTDLGRLRAVGQAMDYEDDALLPKRWNRWSSRRPGITRPMMGLLGDLVVRRWQDEISPLLQMGALFGVGADTSFGLGIYEIV